ncbi:hypothetical protein EsH8_VII_000013 [Colletotrichum jinshuiense]
MSSKVSGNSHVLIQGIPVSPGANPGLRMEFSKWATNTPEKNIQVSLFIRALQKFYDRHYTETLSYFQVAGIHGYPGNIPWDNSCAPKFPSNDKRAHSIYCTHNMLTFPTWHRPYMALFEQTIYELMGEVIENDLVFSNDTEKNTWTKESTQWRLPYWDWALQTEVPNLFRPPEVKIRVPLGPDGLQLEPEIVPNPLYRYQLKVNGEITKMGALPSPYTIDDVIIEENKLYPWSKCSGTSRWAINSSLPDESQSQGINNYESVNKAIAQHGWDNDPKNPDDPIHKIRKHPVSDLVYRLLSNVHDWASFSSTVTSQPRESKEWEQWISLEYIHNNLHGFIGGSGGFQGGIGHMMNVPVAAYDPIFYMHHCNIDRLLAIWQVLNEKSWFAPKAKPPATDKLTPFHHEFPNKTVDYFDSDSVRCWENLGYQYDDLQRHDGENDTQYVARIRTYVDSTYHGTGYTLLHDRGHLFKNQPRIHNNTYDDYVINVKYDRYAYENGAPYTIHFFLGAPLAQNEITASGASLFEIPRHVGSIFTFSSPINPNGMQTENVPHCTNCAQQRDDGVLSRASVPLTIPLYSDAINTSIDEIKDLSPDDVEPYLRSKLSWVAVSTDGEIIPWSKLNKTKVFVLKGKAKHFHKEGNMSVYQGYTPLPSVTAGKDAGALDDEYYEQ